MYSPVEECSCRILSNRKASPNTHLVILASSNKVREIRNIVAVSLDEGSFCTGNLWREPDGRTVEVLEYNDKAPSYETAYDLEICNGGEPLTPEDLMQAKRWRGLK